jgi:hypothetical protein
MRRKSADVVGLEPPEWVNDAGYRYRSRRAFDAAQEQIREERRVLQQVRAGERLATPEERAAVSPKFPRPPYAPPGRGYQGSVVAVVVIATVVALATIMALSVYLLVSLVGS